MEIFATLTQKVTIDPLEVIKQINVIPDGDFVKVDETGEPWIMEEVSAGQHSFDRKVRTMTKDEFEAYKAKETLIKFLSRKR
jgi:hypothetical protein